MRLKLHISILFFYCFGLLLAQNNWQEFSNVRYKVISNLDSTMVLDSNFVFPNSIKVRMLTNNSLLDSSQYQFNFEQKTIQFNIPIADSLLVSYRILPKQFNTTYSHKKYQPVPLTGLDTFLLINAYYYEPNTISTTSFLDFGGLQYSGNFARGVQFGSNQDLSLNSNLDLRLSGKIANDIEIIAALTDQNIPLQPDGTTQQIQDFDKIYIQINKEPHHIVAGDFNQRAFDASFMKFSKQLQGLAYSNNFIFKNQIHLKTTTGFAVARGRFARNVFFGSEANQGPYRLIGSNNETFIIILAGTEKVYVDGILLTRGETNDYVIDYNSGEVLFMPRFLITKDKRIVVEFEYTERNYFRSTLHNAIDLQYKKWNVYTQVYSEQDAKNKPILNDLSDSAIAFLSTIGNNTQNAFFSGVKEVAFDITQIRYKKIDSIVNGISYDSVFVYSTNANDALYQLNFTFVGYGNGNYVPSKNANNIRVYEWKAPVNGNKQGSYEPVLLLITPKSQQMAVAGVQYSLNKMTLKSEIAFSNFDKNKFSTIDNKQNKGYALYAELIRTDTLKAEHHQIKTSINYEFKQANFRQIEPYRNQEFIRDWNISNINSVYNEHLIKIQENYTNTQKGIFVGYKLSSFLRSNNFVGFEHLVPFRWHYKQINIQSELRQLNTKDTLYHTSFLRPTLNATYTLTKAQNLKFGVHYLLERNILTNKIADTLSNSSFKFNIAGINIQLPDTNKWSFILDYSFRNDFNGKNKQLHQQSFANTIDFKGAANQLKNQLLLWSFTFRDLQVKDSLLAKTPSERTYLGRIEYGNRLFKTAIRSNFIYELGGGQERIRQYTYIQVQAGQGFYKWIDENANTIQELNEFVPAQFTDSAQYIRAFTDLNEYINAYTTAYTQTITLTPKATWFNEKGIKKFISNLQIQSYFNTKRKTLKNEKSNPFNPFILNTNNANIVHLSANNRNIISWKVGDPIYSINYNNQTVFEKILLVNGFDIRKRLENTVDGYYNIKSRYTINYKISIAKQIYLSEFFADNNYDLRVYAIEPKITYTHKTLIRTSLGYGFLHKRNIPLYGNERMLSNKLETEFRYSKSGKNTLSSKFSFILVTYDGETTSAKGYTILEGLQRGENYIWNLSYTRYIGNNLELSLTYDGRKTGNAKVVNTGNVQLRAIF